MSINDFSELFQPFRHHTISKHTVLIDSNDAPKGVFFIHSGYIKVYDITSQGNYQLVNIIGPHEAFPLSWALLDTPICLYCETMCTTVISFIPKKQFTSLICHNERLLNNTIQSLAASFDFSLQRIKNLQFKFPKERLAYCILIFIEHFSHQDGTGVIILDIPITNDDIAAITNLTRETVSRCLKQFNDLHYIEKNHRIFKIYNPTALHGLLTTNKQMAF